MDFKKVNKKYYYENIKNLNFSNFLNYFIGCLFEKFLDSLKDVSISKCNYPEVLEIFTAIARRYMDSIDLDTKVLIIFCFTL